MKKVYLFLIVAAVAHLSVSCVTEDRDKCRPTTLRFVYTGDGKTDIFNSKIGEVRLFLYNSDGQLLNDEVIDAAQLDAFAGFKAVLPSGSYRAVCVGNALSNTEIREYEVNSGNDIEIAAPEYFTGGTIVSNDSLYVAAKRFTVDSQTGLTDTMTMASSHWAMYIEVSGLSSGLDEQLELQTVGLAPYVNSLNQVGGVPVTYYHSLTYASSADKYTARYNVLRQTEPDSVYIRLYDGADNLLAEINLGQYLADNPSIDPSLEQTVIPIAIKFVSGSVVVTLPDWVLEDSTPDFIES